MPDNLLAALAHYSRYDDFPHPNDPTLASTFPHHKHVLPNIKRHRVPAPGTTFTKPNLPQIIQEVEQLIDQTEPE